MPSRILLTQPIHPLPQARLAQLGELVVAADTSADTLRRAAAGCAVIVVRAQLPPDIFDAAPSLIGAVRHGAGVDMIPIEAATERGVLVANVPGTNANAVAEHVLSSMLQLARCRAAMNAHLQVNAARGGIGAIQQVQQIHQIHQIHHWARARALADRSVELAGRTVGVIGYGHVGRAIARICSTGLSMKVLAHTRTEFEDGKSWAQRVPLSELLQRSDFVVLACPLTAQTRGLLGAAELALMKPGAFLINVARGPVVQEPALLEALRANRLAGAALDVFDVQPLPDEHPFWQMEQVLITPHVAGITEDSMLRMGHAAAAAVERLLRGEVPDHCINPQAEPAFRQRAANAHAAGLA